MIEKVLPIVEGESIQLNKTKKANVNERMEEKMVEVKVRRTNDSISLTGEEYAYLQKIAEMGPEKACYAALEKKKEEIPDIDVPDPEEEKKYPPFEGRFADVKDSLHARYRDGEPWAAYELAHYYSVFDKNVSAFYLCKAIEGGLHMAGKTVMNLIACDESLGTWIIREFKGKSEDLLRNAKGSRVFAGDEKAEFSYDVENVRNRFALIPEPAVVFIDNSEDGRIELACTTLGLSCFPKRFMKYQDFETSIDEDGNLTFTCEDGIFTMKQKEHGVNLTVLKEIIDYIKTMSAACIADCFR